MVLITKQSLRFAPDILERLGTELVARPEQGIVELARNAYDADARRCNIELIGTNSAGGSLRVTDDGTGLTLDAITGGWLVVGRSQKSQVSRTPLGRLPVGDKGLGRLAALRLGSEARLISRPASEPEWEYTVVIEWDAFSNVAAVEDVPVTIERRRATGPRGTVIDIRNLRVRFGRREMQRLARSLVLLADPFAHDSTSFTARLLAPGFEQFEALVQTSYLAAAEHRLIASLDDRGRATATVYDQSGTELWQARHEELARSAAPYRAPYAQFELWSFILKAGRSFSSLEIGVNDLKHWLSELGGVHLYHRGLRVHPYGDKGHDWLDMNLARARSPEDRPSTNTSIGRLLVPDPTNALLEKTDRSGFVENDEFVELRRFAIDALDWMARQRLRASERRRRLSRIAAPKTVQRARESLREALAQLPLLERQPVERALKRVEKAREKETLTLREEVQLYRMLSTIGTTAAAFAHETAKPVTSIEKMATVVGERARLAVGDVEYARVFAKPIELIGQAARALRPFAHLTIQLLQKQRRVETRIEVNRTISETLSLFAPFLTEAHITPTLGLIEEDLFVHGTEAALQSIIANLITNSINAFMYSKVDLRQIVIVTERTRNRALIRVMDNGPGIRKIAVENIWLPGQTTFPRGTGLGLAIVHDTVVDMNGSIRAVARGELGGAEFIIDFPVSKNADYEH